MDSFHIAEIQNGSLVDLAISNWPKIQMVVSINLNIPCKINMNSLIILSMKLKDGKTDAQYPSI